MWFLHLLKGGSQWCIVSMTSQCFSKNSSHPYSTVKHPAKNKWKWNKLKLTQTQKHRTVWRREACPPPCRRRVAGWVRGPGDRASHSGSAACLLSCCRRTRHCLLLQGRCRSWSKVTKHCGADGRTCFDREPNTRLIWEKGFISQLMLISLRRWVHPTGGVLFK